MESRVRGQRVAVVGPAETNELHGDFIDQFDVVIRPRFDPEFLAHHHRTMGQRTDIAYYSGFDMTELLPVAERPIATGDLAMVVARHFTYKNCQRTRPHWLRFYRHDFSLCPSGGQLGIQRIIYDVLQYQPAELRIFNSDFYTGERMFTPGWRPLDSFGPGSHINDLIAAHDLRADFLFAQALLRCGAVSAQGIAAQVLSMPVDEYLTTVEGASVLH